MNTVATPPPSHAKRPANHSSPSSKRELRVSPFAVCSVCLFVAGVVVWGAFLSAGNTSFGSVAIILACVVPLAMQILGIVYGHKGRHQVRDRPTVYRGRWLATLGLMLGYPAAFFWLWMGFFLIALSSGDWSM